MQAGAPSHKERPYPSYLCSCKCLESRFKVCIDALCAKRRKEATTANPEVGSWQGPRGELLLLLAPKPEGDAGVRSLLWQGYCWAGISLGLCLWLTLYCLCPKCKEI